MGASNHADVKAGGVLSLSLSPDELAGYVARQVSAFAPDRTVTAGELRRFVDRALERTEYCFAHIGVKGYGEPGRPRFNHLHTDQYATFLYYLGNSIFRMEGDLSLAAKVYALNKALHTLDAFYELELPDIMGFQHPVGTVLGRATYSNYFFCYQRCTIGLNLDGKAPVLGEGVMLFSNCAIIGDCTVGANTWLSVGTLLMDADVPPDSVVFGQSPRHVIKPTARNVVAHFFRP
jgi:serine O-acetyltransferase